MREYIGCISCSGMPSGSDNESSEESSSSDEDDAPPGGVSAAKRKAPPPSRSAAPSKKSKQAAKGARGGLGLALINSVALTPHQKRLMQYHVTRLLSAVLSHRGLVAQVCLQSAALLFFSFCCVCGLHFDHGQ